MNRRPTRTTTLLLTAAALGAATLTGCASGSSTVAASSTPAVTTSSTPAPSASTPSQTPTETPTPTPTPTPTEEGQLVEITVAQGKVTGPKGRVKVKEGSTVILRVTSDVADEIHLHGYDKHADVEKGGTADLKFKATVTGVFEVELEEKGLQLVQLQVQ